MTRQILPQRRIFYMHWCKNTNGKLLRNAGCPKKAEPLAFINNIFYSK